MGALAAAACAWSARGDPAGYGAKWAALARRGRSDIARPPSNGGFLNGRCASTTTTLQWACF